MKKSTDILLAILIIVFTLILGFIISVNNRLGDITATLDQWELTK